MFFFSFLIFFADSSWQHVNFCLRSPLAILFGSDTTLKSELDVQCLILRVILITMTNFKMVTLKSMISPGMYYCTLFSHDMTSHTRFVV